MIEGRDAAAPLVPIMSRWGENQRAVKTREHLSTAGVTRPRLTENTATTMHVGFRSWSDTGITWLALAGVDAAKMQRRAGHDHITTTIGYVKAAEDVTGKIGDPFPPLPACLVQPSQADRAKDWAKRRGRPPKAGKNRPIAAERAGFEPAAAFWTAPA